MKQTAVEWLCSQIYTIQVELECGNNHLKNKIEQAKEIEKKQQDDFAIEFFKWVVSEEARELLHDLEIVGEIDINITTEKLLEIFKNK